MKPLFLFLILCALFSHPYAADFTLSGTVTESETGAPVTTAKVSFVNAASGDTLAHVVTGENGGYSSVISWSGVKTSNVRHLPREFALHQVQPNPISSSTHSVSVLYSSSRTGAAPSVQLYDILGRRVSPSGTLAAGIYFLRLAQQGTFSNFQKISILSGGRLNVRLLEISASSLSLAKSTEDSLRLDCYISKDDFKIAHYALAMSGDGSYRFYFELQPVTDAALLPGQEQKVINDLCQYVSLAPETSSQYMNKLLAFFASRP